MSEKAKSFSKKSSNSIGTDVVIKIKVATKEKFKSIGLMGDTPAKIIDMLTEFYLQNKDKVEQSASEPTGEFKEVMVPATGRVRLTDYASMRIRVYPVKEE